MNPVPVIEWQATAVTGSLPVAGVEPFSTCDWPGRLVATVFVAGCPWRCGYCHNAGIQSRDAGTLDWDTVRRRLAPRAGFLDGVVFSGGEPTLAPQLPDWMDEMRALGFGIGLHTAGIYPDRLARVVKRADWIGLDVKAAPGGIDAVTRVPGSEARVWRALDIVQASGTPFECRTTLDPGCMNAEDLYRLADTLAARGIRQVALQLGRQADGLPLSDPARWPGAAVLDYWRERFVSFSWREA